MTKAETTVVGLSGLPLSTLRVLNAGNAFYCQNVMETYS